MGAVGYATVVSEAKLDSSLIERDDAEVIDVTFVWGDALDRTVLAVKHLAIGAGVSAGEDGDLCIPERVLGARRVGLVEHVGGAPVVVVPNGARATIDGMLASSSRIELARGRKVEVAIGDFAIRFDLVAAPKRIAAPSIFGIFRSEGTKSVLGSAVVHAMLIGAVALFMPSLKATYDDEIDHDRIVDMQRLLNASMERERERDDSAKPDDAAGGDSMPGQPAAGPEGQAGTDSKKTDGRMAIKGDAKPHEQTFSKEQALADVNDSAFLGMIATSSTTGPRVPWGTFQNGSDDRTALGSLFGTTIDDVAGMGGLGLHGPDWGGGGKGQWIGLNGIAGLGQAPGHCTGDGPCDGVGNGRTKLTNGYTPKGVSARPDGTFRANGRLDPAIIQRVIQANWGRYRFCYETGLRTNPTLAGHVGVRFVIDRTGAVSMSMESGSTLPDSSVNQCVARAFTQLSFPAPDGGQVTVDYGFMFSPG